MRGIRRIKQENTELEVLLKKYYQANEPLKSHQLNTDVFFKLTNKQLLSTKQATHNSANTFGYKHKEVKKERTRADPFTPRVKEEHIHNSFLLKEEKITSRHRHTTSAINSNPKRRIRKQLITTKDQGSKKECRITEEEKMKYGNRFPLGYKKITLLGKGGCALVWSARDSNENKVAIKQFAKSSKTKADIESAYVEVKIGKLLFDSTMFS